MTENQIDHDRLFKELLETFFAEFMELFFPEAARSIDLTQIRFLQQEIFTDVAAGDRHKVDILVETSLKGQPGLILVHIEPQSYVQKNFNERMFIYFSRLYEKYRRKILPVAVFGYDRVRDEPDSGGPGPAGGPKDKLHVVYLLKKTRVFTISRNEHFPHPDLGPA